LERRSQKREMLQLRRPIFDATMQFIVSIIQHPSQIDDSLKEFLIKTRDKRLFYNKKICDHLNLLYNRANDLATIKNYLANGVNQYEKEKASKQYEKLLLWFQDQLKETEGLFEPYLSIIEK
jgi:hypothetical protein